MHDNDRGKRNKAKEDALWKELATQEGAERADTMVELSHIVFIAVIIKNHSRSAKALARFMNH